MKKMLVFEDTVVVVDKSSSVGITIDGKGPESVEDYSDNKYSKLLANKKKERIKRKKSNDIITS